jgi:hypothetical protein
LPRAARKRFTSAFNAMPKLFPREVGAVNPIRIIAPPIERWTIVISGWDQLRLTGKILTEYFQTVLEQEYKRCLMS